MLTRKNDSASVRRRWPRRIVSGFLALIFLPLAASAAVFGGSNGAWWQARREPTGLAPDPAAAREAIVQVYAARAFGWRGAFGVHTWIAVKPAGVDHYRRFEVLGWAVMHGGDALRVTRDRPDNYWYGARPKVVADLRGPIAARAIPKIEAAVESYPYRREYILWPGPNSNTFTAFIGRAVPELRLDLPPTAVGKDYLPGGAFAGMAPSGTGVQLSLFGLAGLLVAVEEGIEINFLGLTLGLDLKDPALKLPGIGRLGSG